MSRRLTGQITVAAAGTEVRGSNVPGTAFAIKAHPDNAGDVYVGNNGSNGVAAADGYVLEPAEEIEFAVDNLDALWFDAAQNGDKFCWAMVED